MLDGIILISSPQTLYVIDIGHETPDVSLGQKLAVLSCQGLMNRDEEGAAAVYTVKEGWDQEWMDTALEQDLGWDVVIHLTIQGGTVKKSRKTSFLSKLIELKSRTTCLTCARSRSSPRSCTALRPTTRWSRRS